MITDLHLQNFRSYLNDSFEFSPGVNIIVGPNASGKTNLLEALLVVGSGRSYRARDSELVKFKKPWARLDVHLQTSATRTVKITPAEAVNKLYELDGKIYKRLPLEQTLPSVLFEPNHLQLLSGEPERRREYLDDLLEQTVAGYGSLRRKYRRALAQRNALLKNQTSVVAQLFPWDLRLSELAEQVVVARSQLAVEINKQAAKLYKELSGSKTRIKITYEHKWPLENYASQMVKTLENNLELDKTRGFTGAGPHREDLLVFFDGHAASETASRGELRTLLLALKIAELKIIETARGTTPILLLDDVFSELDGRRRHALTDYLAPYQTFITTTDADVILKHFTAKCNVIALN